MNKLPQIIASICAIGFILFLGHLLSPWFNELSGEDKPTDAELCGNYTPYRGKDNVLMCWCTDSERQIPGKC